VKRSRATREWKRSIRRPALDKIAAPFLKRPSARLNSPADRLELLKWMLAGMLTFDFAGSVGYEAVVSKGRSKIAGIVARSGGNEPYSDDTKSMREQDGPA
jgi:hypothetical protein